jgi:hypothetical protein
VPEQLTLEPAEAEQFVITEPGSYPGLPEAIYHDDPIEGGSRSSTGARKLLDTCPAKFRWWCDNREPFRQVFEEGKAAHRKQLGVGPDLVLVEGDGKRGAEWWDTDKAKAKVATAREAGHVPLKPSQMAMVDAMRAALLAEPLAAPLLDPDQGATELSLFWRRGTVWGRARLDRLTKLRSGRPVVVDFKTCASAAPADVDKSIARYGYHIQGEFYRSGAIALGLVPEDAGFLLVMQEKEPPYLVTVVEPDFAAMRMGEIRVRQAFDEYAECVVNGRWPGYCDDIHLAELPPWETRELNGAIW